MNQNKKPLRKIEGLIFFFAILTIQVIQATLSWPLLKYWKFNGDYRFQDLGLTQEQIRCELNESSCSNLSPFVYGKSLLLFSKFFRVHEINTDFLGWLTFITLTSLVLSLIAQARTQRTAYALTAFLMVAPPYQLLVERMNLDAFILIGTFSAAFFASRGKYLTSVAFLTFITLAKFYTILTLLMIPVNTSRLRKRLFYIFFCTLSFVTFFQLVTIRQALTPLGGGAFGVPVLSYWISKFGNFHVELFVTMLVLGILTISFMSSYSILRKIEDEITNFNDFEKNLSRFLFLVVIVTYLGGPNWDYRLIFLNLLILMILSRSSIKSVSKLVYFQLLTYFVLLNSLSFNVAGYLQFVGDLAISLSILIVGVVLWHDYRIPLKNEIK